MPEPSKVVPQNFEEPSTDQENPEAEKRRKFMEESNKSDNPFVRRAAKDRLKGQIEQALRDYGEAIRLDPKSADAYCGRGETWFALQRYRQAVDDLTEAIRLDPMRLEAHCHRGASLGHLGQTDEAIADYQKVRNMNPNYPDGCNGLAWVRATHPDSRFRDGSEAVALAQRAVELSHNDAIYLDTLAAAYAEIGRFPDAVRIARKALNLAKQHNTAALMEEIQARTRLYETGTPFRDLQLTPTQSR